MVFFNNERDKFTTADFLIYIESSLWFPKRPYLHSMPISSYKFTHSVFTFVQMLSNFWLKCWSCRLNYQGYLLIEFFFFIILLLFMKLFTHTFYKVRYTFSGYTYLTPNWLLKHTSCSLWCLYGYFFNLLFVTLKLSFKHT